MSTDEATRQKAVRRANNDLCKCTVQNEDLKDQNRRLKEQLAEKPSGLVRTRSVERISVVEDGTSTQVTIETETVTKYS